MFELQNRIIIVDDTEDHLNRLGREFLNCGLGCRTIKYDAMFDSPLKNVRLAFFDINLLNKNLDLSQQQFDYSTDATLRGVFNDLENAIKSYIDVKNGPYALIFWTSNTILIENFQKYINDRNIDLPKPVLVAGISKDEFLNQDKDSDGNTIKDKIATILSNTPTNLLFQFEENAQQIVAKSINEIYALIPESDRWGENDSFNENFDIIFSKIAASAIGFTHAEQNPDKAILTALAPAVFYDLINIQTEDWKKYLSSVSNKDLKYPNNFAVGKLNSIFHVDSTSVVDSTKRGAVFEFIYNYIPDTEKCTRFDYFKKLNELSVEFCSRFIQLNSTTTSEKERDLIRGKSKFIVIEISAACDYSQAKKRNHKFILGLLTPVIENTKIDSNRINDSVFYKDIPIISFKEENYQIWLNLNFSFSDFEINNNIGEPLFILKKEIMDMIGNRYANHVSRIGITSF